MFLRSLLILGVFLFGANATAQVGSVLRSVKIGRSSLSGIEINHLFGRSLAALGDLNGDGIVDLAVGAPGDAAIWILFLGSDGTVQTFHTIQSGLGFGSRLAAVGDLDGDGLTELATTTSTSLVVLFLNPDGTPRGQRRTLFTDPVFVPATPASFFTGGGLCALGDLDGDGIRDLALGSPRDQDGGIAGWSPGSIWILLLNGDGSLKATQKISKTQGGFGGALGLNDLFGHALMLLGDLDSDGNPEIGVGSPNADGSRRFWVISLQPDGTVLNQVAYGAGNYNLGAIFMDEFDVLGDLDGDGITEVAMGFPQATLPGATHESGGFAVGFLHGDGSVKKRLAIADRHGGFDDIPNATRFGSSFAPLGDLDGDGAQEIAVGAPNDAGKGAVWILSLDPSAVRNGSGVNPLILSQTAEPVIGTTWSVTLDCSGHTSGLAAVLGYSSPTSGALGPFGEVLVNGTRYFHLKSTHTGGPTLFQLNVPPAVELIDVPMFVQGACTGPSGAQLSNALDVLIGR